MKRKTPVGIHSSKRTRSSMRLFARRRSRHEHDSSCSWCSRKWSLVSHDSNFCPFFLAPFSPLSWSLVEQAYLDMKEFWVSCGTKNTHNILATYLFARAFVPSKSKFLPLFHALTVCDTTSFSAGHEIAKIVNMDFCKFVSYWRKYCCYMRPWNKIKWNLDITNLFVTTSSAWRPIFLYPSNSKQYEKEPRDNETSLYLL